MLKIVQRKSAQNWLTTETIMIVGPRMFWVEPNLRILFHHGPSQYPAAQDKAM
ncbi:hypothetical protein [Glutamicibacter uratoxydans]|uniref:hypothetical protein n=1 Tax=Glutamicibacter uratoxydans TaxID=43667 RepID=UPI001476DBFF|nr:hypothetical protein [Glutamicibacter uratoxydans]